jgi:hypothetical protein
VTSFVSWVGADSRGPSSIYFASDSRISWGTAPLGWDTGRKVFACRDSPEIFGYTGYVLLPSSILNRAVDFIDRKILRPLGDVSPEQRADDVAKLARAELTAHTAPINDDFTIFYAARLGDGMHPRASFRFFQLHCLSGTRIVTKHEIPIPCVSSVLRSHGTGAVEIDRWSARWDASDQGGTSRATFSAFCDALRGKADPRSGGEPQLVGLYRRGNGNVFGLVTQRGSSYEGILGVEVPSSARIEWRDESFQRVKQDGTVIKNAQRHARPAQLR